MMNGRDEIRIENLECFAYHGVYPEENKKGQHFYVNATLYTDISKAACHDDLKRTTNYGEVARFINDFMAKDVYKLIETVAEKMAAEILLAFPFVHKLDLEIRKPNAPINLNFTSVSVKITRGWQRVYIATGSNLGDCEKLIGNAVAAISAHPQIREVRASKLFRSTPYGMTGQPDFVNGAATFLTLLAPIALLDFLQTLEKRAGREKKQSVRWAARTLDLDILLYENWVIAEDDLIIPHPDLHNRDFVLLPLISLNKHLNHPTLNRGMSQLLDDLTDRHVMP
jgi:dihydroneopterin aldolase/2-amino-4-hydroxy-6-hydroxymethyldihydropteridine diphosphokinase